MDRDPYRQRERAAKAEAEVERLRARLADLEAQAGAQRAALERIGTRCLVFYAGHPEDTTCLSRQRDARINPEDYGLPLRDELISGERLCAGCIAASALAPGAGARAARILAAVDEFRAAALAEEAQTGDTDDEAHRRAWDRYMAAKRALVAAGESSSEGG